CATSTPQGRVLRLPSIASCLASDKCPIAECPLPSKRAAERSDVRAPVHGTAKLRQIRPAARNRPERLATLGFPVLVEEPHHTLIVKRARKAWFGPAVAWHGKHGLQRGRGQKASGQRQLGGKCRLCVACEDEAPVSNAG